LLEIWAIFILPKKQTPGIAFPNNTRRPEIPVGAFSSIFNSTARLVKAHMVTRVMLVN
jgi:hypothetical protein